MIVIDKPACDWVGLPFKDKRRGSHWLCRACSARGKGKNKPKCPCAKITLGGDNLESAQQ